MNVNNLFPDRRESGDTTLRQCQEVMLRMLKILDFLCRKKQVEYFLVGGSLLGAIRHKGFIPWDDDLDVGMTRENFRKFEKLVVPDLPNDIFYQTPDTDQYFPACHMVEAKLKDKYSSYILKDDLKHRKWHQGLQVDIFVYDRAYLPHNLFIYALNRALLYFFNNKGHKRRAGVLSWIDKNIPLPLVYASSFICNRKMIKYGTNFIRTEEIKNLIKVRFEDAQVQIPAGWDACLRRQYGEYMQLPPEEERQYHGASVPDPFNPCDHTEILRWQERVLA